MDGQSRPPAYAWNWFARQRLLWRETRRRLATGPHASAPRYRTADTKGDVIGLLKADYPGDEHVRHIVTNVVAELTFLGQTDVTFGELGTRHPPRGMRWWWTAITGEEVNVVAPASPPTQLSLTDVHEGFGD